MYPLLDILVILPLNQRADRWGFFRRKSSYPRKSKFSDSQIMNPVRGVEVGVAVPDISRELGISTATLYKWRVKHGGLNASIMSHMKDREDKRQRLKKRAP